MKDCVFCQIVEGRIPSYGIFEDEHFLAFLAVPPLNPGHTLVIPKKHFRWVWDVPINDKKVPNIGQYYSLVAKIAKALKKSYGIDYVISLVFGEEVPHAHVWLVPRFKNDGHGGSINLSEHKEISDDEMKKISLKIKKNIN